MTNFINLSGTTISTFKIGKGGVTLHQGSSQPTGGEDGDFWFNTAGQLHARISGTWQLIKFDNISLSGNTISSTDTNGDINLVPDGNGSVEIGGTGTGGLVVDKTGTGNDSALFLDADNQANKAISFRTGTSLRWVLLANDLNESGSNAGSDFSIVRFSDAGAPLGAALYIVRDTGEVLISDLAGSGTRMVVADSFGLLSTQAINTGTVTSVAVSGTDGIEVDSGSPITTSGTITLGLNTSTLETNINHDNLTGFVSNEHIDWTSATQNLSTTGSVSGSNISGTNTGDQNVFETFTITDTDSGFTWSQTGSAVAGSTTDTLTFVSGSGINLDVDTSTGAIRIESTLSGGTVTSVGAGDGMDFTAITGSGDVTLGTPGSITSSSTNNVTATSHTHAIANNAITNAMFRDSTELSVIGRSVNSTGDPADISASSDGHVLRRSGTTLGFGQITTAGIANNAVSLAKLADIATASFIGRTTAGTGDPQVLTATQAKNILSITASDISDVETSASDRARANHTGTQTMSTISDAGDLATLNTVSATEIDNEAVTLAKLQHIATDSFLGRDTAGTGDVEILNAATVRTILNVADGSEPGTVTSVAVSGTDGIEVDSGSPITTSGTITLGLNTGTLETNLNHDNLTGFVANEHIDWTSATQNLSTTGSISGSNLSGTNTGDQTISLTGDVTGSGTGSFAATISNDVVTFDKMQNVATAVILGRDTSGTGNIEALSVADTKALLTISSSDISDVSSSASDRDRSNHTGTQTLASISDSGALAALNTVGTSEIDNNAVTFEKLEDVAEDRIIGRISAGTGDAEELTAAQVRTLLNIEDNAAADQNLFETFTITDTDSGYTWSETGSVTASTTTDTLTLVSGAGIDLDVDATNGAIRIESNLPGGTVTEVTVGTGLDVANGTTTPNITLDLSELPDGTGAIVGTQDEIIYLDNGVQRRKQVDEWDLGQFNNDQGWTSNTGTVTSVAVSGTDGIEVDSGSPITNSGTITLGLNTSTLEANLNHDNLTGFVSNEHIDWTSATQNLDTSGTASAGNITIDTNTISSTDTNGDINLTPNGTGDVVIGTNTGTSTFIAGDDSDAFFEAGAATGSNDGADLYLRGGDGTGGSGNDGNIIMDRGTITISDLSGVGTRNVLVNASGELSAGTSISVDVTVGTTAPVSPAVGDIWVDTN